MAALLFVTLYPTIRVEGFAVQKLATVPKDSADAFIAKSALVPCACGQGAEGTHEPTESCSGGGPDGTPDGGKSLVRHPGGEVWPTDPLPKPLFTDFGTFRSAL